MYTDAVSFKVGHSYWVFHIRWPTSVTAAHCKTNTFLNKNLLPLLNCSYFPYKCKPGAHHLEPSTALYFCQGVFTDKSIFSLNLPRTRTPTRAHRPIKISAWLISNFTRKYIESKIAERCKASCHSSSADSCEKGVPSSRLDKKQTINSWKRHMCVTRC